MKPVMIDLFAGRMGWSRAFLEKGFRVIAFDIVMPTCEIPEGVEYILRDILTLTAEDLRAYGAVFATCSSPCEEFSVHGMKHFHPNPKHPDMGIKLFNHSRDILEDLGIPYVMENVGPTQDFIGECTNHLGPFYLWGPGVPALFPPNAYKVVKGVAMGSGGKMKGMTAGQKKAYRKQFPMLQVGGKSKARSEFTARAAMIPMPIAQAVAEVAARYIP